MGIEGSSKGVEKAPGDYASSCTGSHNISSVIVTGRRAM
jgi:hypothetical protein